MVCLCLSEAENEKVLSLNPPRGTKTRKKRLTAEKKKSHCLCLASSINNDGISSETLMLLPSTKQYQRQVRETERAGFKKSKGKSSIYTKILSDDTGGNIQP